MWTTALSVADSSTTFRSAGSRIDGPRTSMKSVPIALLITRARCDFPSPAPPVSKGEGNLPPSWWAASRAKLLEHPDWKLFFLNRELVERLLYEANQHGLLDYHAAGTVTRLTFPKDTLEEYANGL